MAGFPYSPFLLSFSTETAKDFSWFAFMPFFHGFGTLQAFHDEGSKMVSIVLEFCLGPGDVEVSGVPRQAVTYWR